MSFEKQSLMPYSVTPCSFFCRVVSFFNFFDQVLGKRLNVQCDPGYKYMYICCICEHVRVCVSEVEITKPYSLPIDSDLLCEIVPIITHYTHFWPITGSRSTVWRALGGGKNMLIGVRKPEFLQVPPLTMKILLSGGDRVGSSPKTCFCFSLSSRGLHLHTGDLPSSSKQERHFPLNAVLTAPHASHLPTPTPPYPCPSLRDLSAVSCSAQGPDSIHSCRLHHQS